VTGADWVLAGVCIALGYCLRGVHAEVIEWRRSRAQDKALEARWSQRRWIE
jgi:hypothetical protein